MYRLRLSRGRNRQRHQRMAVIIKPRKPPLVRYDDIGVLRRPGLVTKVSLNKPRSSALRLGLMIRGRFMETICLWTRRVAAGAPLACPTVLQQLQFVKRRRQRWETVGSGKSLNSLKTA